MRLLVVEDEVKLAQYLHKGLSENGHVVDVAHDGIDGRRLATGGDYDLVLLDVMLPGVDGFGVLQAIRADPRPGKRSLPVLMLTARGELSDRVVGLELGADPDYPMRINRDAPVRLAQLAMPLMASGGRIVFVTSHQAHFHGAKHVPADYVPIAESKRAGEDALRAMQPEFASRDIDFTVVSGDMIEGTIIIRLLQRRDPDAVAARRTHGALPTVDQFASAIVEAVNAPTSSDTIYVGGSDYFDHH
mgnify:CR=1 FL=1